MDHSTIRVGDQLFLTDGTEAFGAVRHVHRGDAPSLTIWVENHGEEVLDGRCVVRAHDGKVEVTFDELPVRLREHIRHAHEAESKR